MSNIKIIGKIGQFTTTTKTEDVDVDNIIWFINNNTPQNNMFQWDPNHDMKGRIKNFIVGIWPKWTDDEYKTAIKPTIYGKYTDTIPNKMSADGGMIEARDLIELSYNYAKNISANFIPYLLPPDADKTTAGLKLDPSKNTAIELLFGLDIQFEILNNILQDVYTKNGWGSVKCQGILISQEIKYSFIDDVIQVIQAIHINAALRSDWSNKANTKNINKYTKIAWAEKAWINNGSLPCYKNPLDKIITPSCISENIPDFNWPDLYEASWKGNWQWKEQMLFNCCVYGGKDKAIGCGIQQPYKGTYSIKKELYGNKATYKCTGSSGGTPDGKDPSCNANNISKNNSKCNTGTNTCLGFKYSIPANKWGDLCKKNWNLSPPTNLYNMTFVAGGPGANFAIQNSGFGIGKECPKTKNEIHTLQDLVNNIQKNFGTKKWTIDGITFFKSRTISLYG